MDPVTRLRALAAAAAVALLLTAGGCDSPEGTRCGQDGGHLYSSEHGNFTCRDGRWQRG
jgi:hypothetical protein